MQKIKLILKLKKPVKIKYAKRAHAEWDAEYEPKFLDSGEIKSHKIVIFNNPDRARSRKTLVAHELIHAWQAENDVADVHGKPFQKMARKIAKHNPKLRDIYLPDVDLD
jgi:Zn-dependent peptidase ImmA (M78 family)